MGNSKIKQIHPLNFMQRALLMHNLYEKRDEGVIHVNFLLEGALDLGLFAKAWHEVVTRHDALRTSIHWEKIAKPVQVVHDSVSIPWENVDWSADKEDVQHNKVKEMLDKASLEKMDLSKAPTMGITLVKFSEAKYFLLWRCHHILLDGWSSNLILNEVMACYEKLFSNENTKLPKATSYFDYLKWVKKQDISSAEVFWKQNLAGYDEPTLIASDTTLEIAEGSESIYKTLKVDIPLEKSEQLRQLVLENRTSLNTLFQGIWSILLGKYLNSNDVVFGTTVSGRTSLDLDGSEEIIGMLMNVLPMRVNLKDNLALGQWFNNIQTQQADIIQFEYLGLDQILYFKNWSGNISLFDSLFVFESFPESNLTGGGVSITNFKGGVTTTYPLTLIVHPENQISVNFKYNQTKVSTEVVEDFGKNLIVLIDQLITDMGSDLNSLIDTTKFQKTLTREIYKQEDENSPKNDFENLFTFNRKVEGGSKIKVSKRSDSNENYVGPENSLQLGMCQIWEDLFGFYPIGIKDNFFELGGSSIMAIQMFSQIEKSFGFNVSPTVLLNNPTVKQLCEKISNEGSENHWGTLVPLRDKGDKQPLFCIHAGGGHVFFFNDLAKHLPDDQPIYAIQPVGLDGIEKAHDSIEEMATFYIDQIKKVQPVGPYSLLGSCFSDAVAIEMAVQLAEKGEKVHPLFIIDNHPTGMKAEKPPLMKKIWWFTELIIKGRIGLFIKRVKTKMKSMLSINKFNERYKNYSGVEKTQYKSLQSLRQTMFSLYEQYEWKTYDGDIVFVQSEEFNNLPWKKMVIQTWKNIAKGNIAHHVIPGEHYSLFEEPNVQGLSKKIAECLVEANLKINKEDTSINKVNPQLEHA